MRLHVHVLTHPDGLNGWHPRLGGYVAPDYRGQNDGHLMSVNACGLPLCAVALVRGINAVRALVESK